MSYIRKLFMHYLIGTHPVNWARLLIHNKFRIKWWCLPKVIVITLTTLLSSPLVIIEKILYNRKIKNTEIRTPPVFIIGHWRSGTTYLVNLMSQDRQFGFFTILQIYAPSICLTFNSVLKRIAKKIMPDRRPMDNIRMSVELPQEESYALANIFSCSIIHMAAFPANRQFYVKYGLFEDLRQPWVKKWRALYLYLLKKITLMCKGKRLLLKSPSNTTRIKALLQIFPDAKFIHIYRDPYKVCASTLKMYRKLFALFTLQGEANLKEEAEDFQIDLYSRFYKKFFSEKHLIPEGNLVEIRYEDFIEEPLQNVQKIYKGLKLKGFKTEKSRFQEFIESEKGFKTNKHDLEEAFVNKIKEQCRDIFRELGYEM